jgi:hypothetical protein
MNAASAIWSRERRIGSRLGDPMFDAASESSILDHR